MPSGGSSGAQTTQSTPISAETAKDRALGAEEERVKAILGNTTDISGSVGDNGETNPTVLNYSTKETYVKVTMSYSYEYHCDGKDGNIDGLTTEVVYKLTNDSTQLVEVLKEVQLMC